MATLPWLEELNYSSKYPQYSGRMNNAGVKDSGNDLLSFLTSMQPTAAQSLGSSLPFLNLPKKQAAYYQPFYETVGAMSDPDSEKFQKLYGRKRQIGQRNLADTIAELQRQNRKAQTLGRGSLFDDERGGETIFRSLSQGYQDIQDSAYDDTFDTLGKLATVQNAAAGQQSQLAANKAGIKGNLQGALIKLFGL